MSRYCKIGIERLLNAQISQNSLSITNSTSIEALSSSIECA